MSLPPQANPDDGALGQKRTDGVARMNGSWAAGTGAGAGAGAAAHAPVAVIASPTPEHERESSVESAAAASGVSTPGSAASDLEVKADDPTLARMALAVHTLLECLGEDPAREGLRRTPMRVAKALAYMTKGYRQTVAEVVQQGVFVDDHSETVVVKDISFHSMCEHHMLPFTGKVHIAYVPSGKVIGLSKLARITDLFARRLQARRAAMQAIQERMTRDIALGLEEAISPLGVMVVVKAEHTCMSLRGVEKQGATTVTTCSLGVFKTNAALRQEFLAVVAL